MRPFYSSAVRRELLLAEAQSWLGTPFRENCAVRGRDGGIDCTHYQAACHTAAGACASLELPHVPVEVVRYWHQHHSVSRILEFLGRPEFRGRVRKVDEGEPPAVGDIAVLRIEHTEHHLGLFTGAHIYHVAIPAGVIRTSVRDAKFMEHVRSYYRIMESPASSVSSMSSESSASSL